MSGQVFDSETVMRVVQASAAEVLGADTLSTNMIVGNVAMQLAAGAVPEIEVPSQEAPKYSEAPNYALRAMRARSPSELLEILREGADRLSKSVASYCTNERRRGDNGGVLLLHPHVFAEGSHEAEIVIGELSIRIEEENDNGYSSSRQVEMWLDGGEAAPCNVSADPSPETRFTQSLSFIKSTLRNPLSGERQPSYFLEAAARYSGSRLHGDEGTVFEAKYGEPIGVEGAIIQANLFWALDMAITYYETVYIAGNKNVGMTYADYRDAGCLDDNLKIDPAKARAHIVMNVGQDGAWPVLRDFDSTVLAMDPSARSQVKEHIERMRETRRAQRAVLQSIGSQRPQ